MNFERRGVTNFHEIKLVFIALIVKMSIHTTADRFKELGLKPPDISFFKKPEKPIERFGKVPQYNSRVLIDNWFEDRRQYKLYGSRCIGDTTYKNDYQPYCPDEKDSQFPPIVYQRRLEQAGEGSDLIRNTEDYCRYLTNYTTTYDLMHNWEVKRNGVKPKPLRKWKIIHGAIWVPETDNATSFGNLTQIGYRKAGQIPMLPNDWDLYGNTGYSTEYRDNYPKWKFPRDYVQCRKATNLDVVKEMRELTMKRKPVDPKDVCGEASLYMAGRKTPDESCKCKEDLGKRHQPKDIPRFVNCIPFAMITPKPAKQTLHLPRQRLPYKALKHPPYKPMESCSIIKDPLNDIPPDFCKDYAGNVRFDWKGILTDPLNGKVC